MKVTLKKPGRTGFLMLDAAVVLAALLLIALLQMSIMHRDAVAGRESTCRKQLKWIAQAQENYYTTNAEYASTFRAVASYFSDKTSFVCPTSDEVYSLYIDEVGRYAVDCQFAGHGGIVSGDPDWE